MGRKAKFNAEQLVDIRKMLANPVFTNRDVMQEFPMSTNVLAKIKKGEHPYGETNSTVQVLVSEDPSTPVN